MAKSDFKATNINLEQRSNTNGAKTSSKGASYVSPSHSDEPDICVNSCSEESKGTPSVPNTRFSGVKRLKRNDELESSSIPDEVNSGSKSANKKRLKRGATISYLLDHSESQILYNTVNGYLLKYLTENGPKTLNQLYSKVYPRYGEFRKLTGHLYTGTVDKTIKGALSSNGLFKKVMVGDGISNDTIEQWQVIPEQSEIYIKDKLEQINNTKSKLEGKRKGKPRSKFSDTNEIEQDRSSITSHFKTPKKVDKVDKVYAALNHHYVTQSVINDSSTKDQTISDLKLTNDMTNKPKFSELSHNLQSLLQVYGHFRIQILGDKNMPVQTSPNSGVKASINQLSLELNKLTKSVEMHSKHS